MHNYKALTQQVFQEGAYSIVPIRMGDRYDIMQWRNEQIHHLRQAEPLTAAIQDAYFENVVATLFDQERPNQLLFSFLKGDKCIGYGGLVHINWIDRHAEISFIMKTDLEQRDFTTNWSLFLLLIEKVAFRDLKMHKIFTYAFDIRPLLYPALEGAGFKKEAVLPEHCFIGVRFLNVVIHGKINEGVVLRPATKDDVEVTYKWATSDDVRRFSLNQNEITRADHVKWFEEKIKNPQCIYYMALFNQAIIGSFRLDVNEDQTGLISYLLDPSYHGQGLGRLLLWEGMEKAKAHRYIKKLVGYVKEKNKVSLHLFNKLGFEEDSRENGLVKFQLQVK
jgi:RimJ/RimL family protein N-acetyltransferase